MQNRGSYFLVCINVQCFVQLSHINSLYSDIKMFVRNKKQQEDSILEICYNKGKHNIVVGLIQCKVTSKQAQSVDIIVTSIL